MRKALLLLALGCATVVGYANHASVELYSYDGPLLWDYSNDEPFAYASRSGSLAAAHAYAHTVPARVIGLASVDQVTNNVLFPPSYHQGRARAITNLVDHVTVRHAFLPPGTPIKLEMRVFGSTHFTYTEATNIQGYGGASLRLTTYGGETGYSRSTQSSPTSYPPIVLNTSVGAPISFHAQLTVQADAQCSGIQTVYGQAITLSEAMIYITPAKAGWCENAQGFIYPRWNPMGPR